MLKCSHISSVLTIEMVIKRFLTGVFIFRSIKRSKVNTINHPQIEFDAPPVYWVVKSDDQPQTQHLST